jgi:cytochrome P450
MTSTEQTTRLPGVPPGSRMPSMLQTMALVYRPRPMMRQNQERFGDLYSVRLFGIGTFVVPGTPELVRQAFTAPGDAVVAGESNELGPILGEFSLLATDGPKHLKQRKLLLPPFHGERMRAYDGLIEQITADEIASWPIGEEFGIVPSTQRITMRAILRAVFGAQGPVLEELERLLPRMTERGSALSIVPWMQKDLGRYSPWGNFLRLRARIDGLLDGLIEEARHDPNVTERVDVLAMLVQAKYEDGEPMGNAEIRDQLVTMLAAGHETTAASLGWAMERLRRNPQVLAKLVADIDAGGTEYLAATVREVQRVRPVIMFTSRLVKKPFQLGGYLLQPGMRIAIGGGATHFDERLFPSAREFMPERFIGVKPGTYSWLPFGGGVRRCPGATFAHMEMEVVLRTILRTYELVPTNAKPEHWKFRGIAYAPRENGQTMVRRRVPATPSAGAAPAAQALSGAAGV